MQSQERAVDLGQNPIGCSTTLVLFILVPRAIHQNRVWKMPGTDDQVTQLIGFSIGGSAVH